MRAHPAHRLHAPVSALPATRLGWWSVGLLLGFWVLFGVFSLLVASGQRGGETFFSNLWLTVPIVAAGLSGVAGGAAAGVAIPSNTVKSVAAQLIRSGKVERAFLGVGVRPIGPELSRTFRLPVDAGLLVENVVPGSGAAKAELKGGDTISLEIYRGEKQLTLHVELGRQPASPQQG